jgi:hypothetical protein
MTEYNEQEIDMHDEEEKIRMLQMESQEQMSLQSFREDLESLFEEYEKQNGWTVLLSIQEGASEHGWDIPVVEIRDRHGDVIGIVE